MLRLLRCLALCNSVVTVSSHTMNLLMVLESQLPLKIVNLFFALVLRWLALCNSVATVSSHIMY